MSSSVEQRIKVLNGSATATAKGVYGQIHSCFYKYAAGGTGTLSVTLIDEHGADLLDGSGTGISASGSNLLSSSDIGGTIAYGDLTITLSGTPDEDFTVVLYIVP